mmetsp:Transcript_22797/g.45208  ORF Transcript_22797/g.45208 Transcript_22797/m.45208 type:complete len:445 (-) Transcript_22797:13-1347(-)
MRRTINDAKAALAPQKTLSAWQTFNGTDQETLYEIGEVRKGLVVLKTTRQIERQRAECSGATEALSSESEETKTVFEDNCNRLPLSAFVGDEWGDSLPEEPCVLTGCCNGWSAFDEARGGEEHEGIRNRDAGSQNWSIAELAKRLPPESHLFSLDGGPGFARQSMGEARVSMEEYLRYCKAEAAEDAAPLYVFDYRCLEEPVYCTDSEEEEGEKEEVGRRWSLGQEVEALGQPLGSVALQWRTALGELGSFRAPATHAPQALRREVEVALLGGQQGLLSSLAVGKAATVGLRVTNNTDRTLSLQLRWRLPAAYAPAHTGYSTSSSSSKAAKSLLPTVSTPAPPPPSSALSAPGIVLHGAASVRLGPVPRGGASVSTSVTLLALSSGLHPIHGVVVVDENSGREYAQPSLATALVLTTAQAREALSLAAAAAAAAAAIARFRLGQ